MRKSCNLIRTAAKLCIDYVPPLATTENIVIVILVPMMRLQA